MKNNLSKNEIEQFLSYDSVTGLFTRIKFSGGQKVGSIAGCRNPKGYIQISINDVTYRAHRLAWVCVYGEWPVEVDHINGDKSDNRIANLRACEKSINMQNIKRPRKTNTTGFLGVERAKNGKFASRISYTSKGIKITVYLGSFREKEAAHEAYILAKRKFHEGCTI